MKKLLLVLFAFISYQSYSQCTDLFISEYVEGNQSNKALEIYNPTNAAIDLSDYQIHRWNNGTDIRDVNYTQVLSGTIPAKGTWVLVKDTNATEIVYFYLRSKADAFITASCAVGPNRTLCHNGNDAYTLEKVSGNTVVDIFAQIGFNPGSGIGDGWNSDPANNYVGVGTNNDVWTSDHSLVRKHTVMTGVTVNPGGGGSTNAFNVSVEWDSLSFNTFDSLRTHTCDCKDYNGIINPNNSFKFDVYPNPTTSLIHIESDETIASITISGISGAVSFNEEFKNNNVTNTTINLKDNKLAAGEYLLTVYGTNGGKTTKRISIY